MAAFKEVTQKGEKYLVVQRHPDDTIQSGIKLRICPPMCGSDASGSSSQDFEKASPSPLFEQLKGSRGEPLHVLCSSIHTKDPRQQTYVTLGRHIINEKTQWGSQLRTQGTFGHVDRYWEWLEDVLVRSREVLKRSSLYDALYASLFTYARNHNVVRAFCEAWCPETNTLHTSVGEMSISLMDLWRIGGLPITGDCYEEVIPSLRELIGLKDGVSRFIPESCMHLFAAYLRCQGEVYNSAKPVASITRWIDFWCRRPLEYSKPITTAGKRTSRSGKTPIPNGIIGDKPRQRSREDDIPFVELQVKENLKDETYLAAFVACWLCLFVLPTDGSFIRPSTFKMASLIAHGRTPSLAVPVLVSIYRGLSKIAYSSTPERADAFLPWHYIVGWMARYLDTHDTARLSSSEPLMVRCPGEGGAKSFNDQAARNLIHEGYHVEWRAILPRTERTEVKIDDGRLFPREKAYFIAVRSNLLVLHCDGTCWVEPYSPCRFARQFGFCQTIPRELGVDSREASLELGKRLWFKFVSPKSRFKLAFPTSPRDMNNHVSSDFWAWWSKVHGVYLTEGRSSLVATIARTRTDAVSTKERVTGPSHCLEDSHVPAPPVASAVATKNKLVVTSDVSDDISGADINWRRKKKKDTKEFEGQDLDVLDGSEPSEQSTNGPDAFGLVLRRTKDRQLPASVRDNKMHPPTQTSHDEVCPQQLDDGAGHTAESENHVVEGIILPTSGAIVDNPIRLPHPVQSLEPAISLLNVDDIIEDHRNRYAKMIWKTLVDKLSGYSLDSLASKKEDVYKLFAEMKTSSTSNLSGLESLLDTFFTNAGQYRMSQQEIAGRLSEASYVEKRSNLSRHLVDARAAEADYLKQTESSSSRLAAIEAEIDKLQKVLDDLNVEKAKVTQSLGKTDEESKSMTARVSQLRDELDVLESTPRLKSGDSETLEKMKELLEINRQELLGFKLLS